MEQQRNDTRRAEEWRAIGRLAGQGLGAVVGIVRDTHSSVTHFQPAPGVYSVVEAAHRMVPVLAAEMIARSGSDAAVPPSQTRAGAAALATVNGLWGDRLEQQAPALAVPMAIRVDAADVPPTADALAAAFPDATGDVVVFVHGLNDHDRAWQLPWEGDSTSYGERLAASHGVTPVIVRYNTGRRISDNGRDLAALMEQLDAAWPVPVTSYAIVGHSMGGLVSRSAAQHGDADGHGWTDRLRTVVTLGSPHLGAPLERAAHVLDRAMRVAPQSEPLGRVLASRSVGIRDLRYGAIMPQDWDGHDPQEALRDRCAPVPLLPHVSYYWVAATLTADPRHPMGFVFGDGMVRPGSASGTHERVGLLGGNGLHVTGIDHVRLLNHPAVYAQLEAWLTGGSSGAGAGRAGS